MVRKRIVNELIFLKNYINIMKVLKKKLFANDPASYVKYLQK